MRKTTTTTTTVVTVVEESESSGGVLAVFALDCSGSMLSKTQQAIDGFNGYLEGIKETVPYVTLLLFNDLMNKKYDVANTSEALPLTNMTYRASGTTALYDAIGSLVDQTESYIKRNPGKISEVVVTIFTDGQENCSRTFTLDIIKAMIARKEAEGNWTFVFMGSELNTYAMGAAMGFSKANTSMYNAVDTRKKLRSVATNMAAYSVRADKNDKDFFKNDTTVNLAGTTKSV